jgi:pimeloyl-ACP methyl ester carboxylesterase
LIVRNATLGIMLCCVAGCQAVPDRAPPPPTVDTVLAADGTPIVYDLRGTGDVALVFIHCWACDRTFWREQLDAFAPGYRVVSLDLAGHGASGKHRGGWSLSGLADDVAAVVSDLGLDRVVLIGHSMGGPVALLAAGRLAGRAEAVICADALHDLSMEITPAVVDPMIASFQADYDGTMQRMVAAMFPRGADTAIVGWVTRKGASADTAATIGLMRDYPNLDLPAAMAAAQVPVRCINAAPRPPAGSVTAIEHNRQYGDFDAVLMDSVGHYLMLERPAAFNANLLDVLAALRLPPGADRP